MANKEHLEILKRGKDEWNKWRELNSDIIPDLSEADLSNLDFGNKDLPSNLSKIFKSKKSVILLSDGRKGDIFDKVIENAKLNGLNLRNTDLRNADFQKTNLSGADLAGAELGGANFRSANLKQANLGSVKGEKANFREAILENANLAAAELPYAIFNEAIIVCAYIQDANLSNSNFFRANLQHSILHHSNIQSSYFLKSDLRFATFWTANLKKSNLSWADLRGADLRVSNLSDANVHSVRFNRKGLYRGIRIATAYGSPIFIRFAQDQDYIEEFRSIKFRYPLYILWLVLSDCGKSFALWSIWSIVAALGFGLKFYSLGENAFKVSYLDWSFMTTLYYSIVTFTTLGFGDVLPVTEKAAMWVMAEVITGYIMLGGLISLFATKIARRS